MTKEYFAYWYEGTECWVVPPLRSLTDGTAQKAIDEYWDTGGRTSLLGTFIPTPPPDGSPRRVAIVDDEGKVVQRMTMETTEASEQIRAFQTLVNKAKEHQRYDD